MKDKFIVDAASGLAKVLNRAVDDHLTDELAGIVKLHAGLGVGAALVPIPGAGLAAAAANTWAMYIRINKELDIPFAENALKSIATGVVTNIGTNAAGVLLVGAAAKMIPGLGSLGGAALMAGSIYAVTIAAGVVYMKALTKLLGASSAHAIDGADLEKAAQEILQDKAAIRSVFKDAKKGYKG